MLLVVLSSYPSKRMRKTNAVHNLGTTGRYSEAMERIKQPGDYVLVLRGIPRAIVLSCPDGCGEHVVINLDKDGGPAWRRYTTGGKLSLYPSVWRDSGCRAHFILVRDRVLWCGADDSGAPISVDQSLIAAVLECLNRVTPTHYESIATSLSAIPWEIAWACATLKRSGLASEPKRGYFLSH